MASPAATLPHVDPLIDPPTEPARFYLPELDSLRFLAFLAVFSFHACEVLGAPFAQIWFAGRFGVDLFFTLSAYLITELLMREKERFRQLDIRSFYIRRILRIWPLYFTFLSIALVYFLLHPAYGVDWIYFAAFAAFVGNFACSWRGAPILVLTILWSVSIEEQFYLAWPLLAARLSRRGVAIAGVTLWLFCAAVRWGLTRHPLPPHVIEYSTFTRLDPIACGLLLSTVLAGSGPRLFARWRFPLCASGIYLWLFSSVCLFHKGAPSAMNVMLAYPMVAVGAAAFMLSAIGASTWMRNPWLIYLGRISYGLYVYHAAVLFVVVPILTPQRWLMCLVVSLAATIAVAAASYRWLESPFLRLKARYQHVRSASHAV